MLDMTVHRCANCACSTCGQRPKPHPTLACCRVACKNDRNFEQGFSSALWGTSSKMLPPLPGSLPPHFVQTPRGKSNYELAHKAYWQPTRLRTATVGDGKSNCWLALFTPPVRGDRLSPVVLMGLPPPPSRAASRAWSGTAKSSAVATTGAAGGASADEHSRSILQFTYDGWSYHVGSHAC